MKDFLTHQQKEQLMKAHRTARSKRDADKIKALLLLNNGYSYEEAAKILLLDDSTIRRYCERYQSYGIDGLDDNYKGGNSYLSQGQKEHLKEHLRTHVYRRAKDIAEYVKKTFGITYKAKGIIVLLHEVGFTYKKPKRVPGKANAQKQEAFVQQYNELKEQKEPNDPIYFMDAMHPHHNIEPVYGWIEKGVTKEVPSNTGRNRININGALNNETHKIIFREDDRINAQSTIELFKEIEKAHPLATRIYVITDNAKYYRAQMVKDYLVESKIEVVPLPSYAPNLNLIERIWRFFREEVCSHYYEHFGEFRMRTYKFLENILDYKEQLDTLLTENFEITGKNFSQTCFV